MNCPNCHKRIKPVAKYCKDPVCKLDRASKRGIEKYKLSTLAKNLLK